VNPRDIERLILAIGPFDRPPSDQGLLEPDALLRRMSGPALPVFIGVAAAIQTMAVHAPAMIHAIHDTMKRYPHLNEWELLTRGILYAIFGGSREVEVISQRAHAAHSQLEGELDNNGGYWTAVDPEVILVTYVALMWSILRTQETLIRPLSDKEADRWCKEAAASVGVSQMMDPATMPVPLTRATLEEAYAELIGEPRTQACTVSTYQAMCRQELNGVSMGKLMSASTWEGLLSQSVVEELGITRCPVPQPIEFKAVYYCLMSMQ